MNDASATGFPRLVELCIDVACESKESVQAWRRQTRTLEGLPSHLAHSIFHRLLHSGLLNPPLLELFRHSLEEVIVSSDGSINAEWTAYFKSFKCLRIFKAANCRSLSNFAISHLKGKFCYSAASLDTLQELNLSCCQKISDEGLSHVLCLTNLKKLGLSETRVTAKGIESISLLKGLTSLDLGGLPVMDSTLQALTTLARLQNLDLWGTNVSDRGVVHLREFRSLQYVNLAWTEVTRIPPVHSLKQLNMAKCTVASIFEGWSGLEGHLEVLNLTGTNILGPLDILAGSGSSNLSVVDFSSSNFRDFKVLESMKKIERLDLSGTMLQDTAMSTIVNIGVNLQHLDLSGCRVTSKGVGVLAGHVPRLQKLVLSGTSIDDSVFEFLKLMPSLMIIDLSYTNVKGCRKDKKDGASQMASFAAMKDLSSLRLLNLRNTPIADNSCLGLLCLSELTHLDLRSELISDSSLQSLSFLKKLVSLSIEGAMLTDLGLLSFTPPPNLEILSLLDCWLLSRKALIHFCEAHRDLSVKHGLLGVVSASLNGTSFKEARYKGSPNFKAAKSKSPAGSVALSIGYQKNRESLTMFSGMPYLQSDLITDERIKFSRSELLGLRKGDQTSQQLVCAGFYDLPPLLSSMDEVADLFKVGSMVSMSESSGSRELV
ncbi:hypothetical protein L7F22_011199 [Adiantum nelumboides]|nr:hypothetical protein [Adiantum nelumboides]